MDTSRLEELLVQLIDKQDKLISRVESLETMLEKKLTETNDGLTDLRSISSEFYEEFNWWSDGHSFAKQVLSSLEGIESEINKG